MHTPHRGPRPCCVLHCAPSQIESRWRAFADGTGRNRSPGTGVTAFQRDEYVWSRRWDDPRSQRYLRDPSFFHGSRWPHFIRCRQVKGEAPGLQGVTPSCSRSCHRPHLHGVGENGHIAFNDPPVANSDDPRQRQEGETWTAHASSKQVNEGCFAPLPSASPRAKPSRCRCFVLRGA